MKEIINIITSRKSKNSHGYEKVSTKLLKISAPYICSPLTYICNKTISLGIFPDHIMLDSWNNKLILQTNFVKFWGITIDNTLSWKQHIDTITPKLNKACYIIIRFKLYLSNDALKWYTMLFSLSNVLWFDFWGKFN